MFLYYDQSLKFNLKMGFLKKTSQFYLNSRQESDTPRIKFFLSSMPNSSKQALTLSAFFTLLFAAFVMGSNHVAARFAIDDGLGVITAVMVRSVFTATVLTIVLALRMKAIAFTTRQKYFLVLIAALIALQSMLLYAAISSMPVSLGLVVFNTYPVLTALWGWTLFRTPPEKIILIASPILLIGLSLALGVVDMITSEQGLQISSLFPGMLYALGSATTFGLALVLTQRETLAVDPLARTALSMWLVAFITMCITQLTGGFQWPNTMTGWGGTLALAMFFATGFTIVFALIPKLGLGITAIMNMEPIFALILAWLLLNQSVSMTQLVGACIVVGTVIALGMRKKR